jgi:uncharacterized protein with gpF-like domain
MDDNFNIEFLFTLKPEEAIKYFQKKGYTISWDWHEVWKDAHTKAFTVAKAMKLDILQDIRDEVDKALEEGETYEDFKRNLRPVLKTDGWWGKCPAKDVPGYTPSPDIDPDKIVQLGSPRRLEIIYRTNLRTSINAGRYKTQMEQIEERPYLQYIQVQRPNKRIAHERLHLKVFRADDPIIAKIYPPNGWGCDCRMRNLSKEEVDNMGLEVTPGEDETYEPETGWDYNPGIDNYEPDLKGYNKELVVAYKNAA